jgi:hypothetical protein
MRSKTWASCAFILFLLIKGNVRDLSAAEARPRREAISADQAIAVLKHYNGPSTPGIDCTTLTGKVMCGYQGWFSAEGDGDGKGWSHYGSRGAFAPGHCGIDLWPDVSELGADEKYPTAFRHADGSAADVFSSYNPTTVLRHFHWMQQYGIDGVFVQRFAIETFNPVNLRHCNVVLDSCRQGANEYGRAYAVMYDLSGLGAGQMNRVIEDWKTLVDRMALGRDDKDKAYLHHGGKPVVAVWGIGFNDGRKYMLAECRSLIDFLKHDPKYGGCTVMLGVPTGWRTLDRDAVADKSLHDVILAGDIVSPWTIGRFNSPEKATRFARERWKPDIDWCKQHGKEYLPVVFPGFSWHNLNPNSKLDAIPRLKGQFLWTQYVEAKNSGATAIYQAMFDEMNEGTAIFKCTNDPPIGESQFVTYEGLPSDYYLWLAGMGGKLIRGEIHSDGSMPVRADATRARGAAHE